MTQPYRILVTGSRTWDDENAVRDALNELLAEHGHLTVVHGACPSGADAVAAEWVMEGGDWPVTEERYPAEWRLFGKSAGFRRNAEMVALGADVVLAFIKDNSRGATHCAQLAEQAGIEVRRWTA